MNTISTIIYRAQKGSGGPVIPVPVGPDPGEIGRWGIQLTPWLRLGKSPGRGYLTIRDRAALIRWYAEDGSGDWQYAVVLVGQPSVLTSGYGLELPDLDKKALREANRAVGRPTLLSRAPEGPLREAIGTRARSPEAIELLVPLLAHALQDAAMPGRRLTIPWPGGGLADAVMWGLSAILQMIGSPPPVSFLTRTSGLAVASRRELAAGAPGLLFCFSEDARDPVPPDAGFRTVASGLAARFAADPEELRLSLTKHMPTTGTFRERVRRLNTLPPASRVPAARHAAPPVAHDPVTSATTASSRASDSSTTAGAHARATSDATAMPAPSVPVSGQVVQCPMCLHRIDDWEQQDRLRWDAVAESYEKIVLPADYNPEQRARALLGAYVRCPGSRRGGGTLRQEEGGPLDGLASAHHLPADYANFGDPVLLGFVGLTKSGKTHLLTSMIGTMGELSSYGITCRPLDPVTHASFREGAVRPLLSQNQVLPGTKEDETTHITDAFIVRHARGPEVTERVVVLFDVAGGDLDTSSRPDETKQFLWIADGLFFVIDPERLDAGRAGGDETFTSVLNVVRSRRRAKPVSAAIVLNKADMVRFEDPVARWLWAPDSGLSAVDFLRESADVYAYLDKRGAAMLAEEPYQACDKATLHVASPTGGAGEGEGGAYPRGVTPLRVLRPLVAMLAMTGVLVGEEAKVVGV